MLVWARRAWQIRDDFQTGSIINHFETTLMTDHREGRIAAMKTSRAATLELFEWVTEESKTRTSPHSGFRPMLWHLAHIGAFEEWWLLIRQLNASPINPRYQVLFDPIRTPREESENLPSRAEIEDYLFRVREGVERNYLDSTTARTKATAEFDEEYIFDLVLEHEYQHQETLAYLLQMLPHESKRRPARARDCVVVETIPAPEGAIGPPTDRSMVRIEGGKFALGGSGHFIYDNEEPQHVVDIAEFSLERLPVTNGQFLEFIDSGGYLARGLWSEAGWNWKEENRIGCPLYWTFRDTWLTEEMFESYPLRPCHPVTGVSWYEAEAFARFAGKRLPTEAEWEKAASLDPTSSEPIRNKRRFPWGNEEPASEHCNFDGRFLGTTPGGAFPAGGTPSGCLDMAGNVWEWTATTFSPYPGFKPYPYPDYSELWFDGDHRVLKGGSWMTRAPLLRNSFRNFFRPGFRFAFAGFRLADFGF